MYHIIYIYTGWWFQTFFIFHNIWDNPSHWLIFFQRGRSTTNQYIYIYTPVICTYTHRYVARDSLYWLHHDLTVMVSDGNILTLFQVGKSSWSTYHDRQHTISGWWFGTWLLFFHIYWEESSQLTFIFFRGVGIPPTRYNRKKSIRTASYKPCAAFIVARSLPDL